MPCFACCRSCNVWDAYMSSETKCSLQWLSHWNIAGITCGETAVLSGCSHSFMCACLIHCAQQASEQASPTLPVVCNPSKVHQLWLLLTNTATACVEQ